MCRRSWSGWANEHRRLYGRVRAAAAMVGDRRAGALQRCCCSAIGAWRRARGLAWRASALALICSRSWPIRRWSSEQREPLHDVAVIVVDDSPSQHIGDRAKRTRSRAGDVDAPARARARPRCPRHPCRQGRARRRRRRHRAVRRADPRAGRRAAPAPRRRRHDHRRRGPRRARRSATTAGRASARRCTCCSPAARTSTTAASSSTRRRASASSARTRTLTLRVEDLPKPQERRARRRRS